MKHVVVAYDKSKWCAVPANNGANGPAWQWGDELLVGFTQGEACFEVAGHQTRNDTPFLSLLARSLDGGETWQVHDPEHYTGDEGAREEHAAPAPVGIDFTGPGFVMRVEGHGYHGNSGQHWFYSTDKGWSWSGPYTFGSLLDHPQLWGRQFTGRTGYLAHGASDCFLFLSARSQGIPGSQVSLTDKVFLAHTGDGGVSFEFISWVVPATDEARAVMPAPARLSPTRMIAAIRRRSDAVASCWIDCYQSDDNGRSWAYLSRVGETGGHNGNPPALVRMLDGRLCCAYGNRDRAVMIARFSEDEGESWEREVILRDDFQPVNGYPDLGYPRLFQRRDGKLVVAYFWCSPERPETHIEATIFDA